MTPLQLLFKKITDENITSEERMAAKIMLRDLGWGSEVKAMTIAHNKDMERRMRELLGNDIMAKHLDNMITDIAAEAMER